MQYRDEFDGPDSGGVIGSIFSALGRRDRIRPRKPLRAAATVLALSAFLGSVLWYSYPREAEKREIMAAPIIRADAGPVKVVPTDPGGMDILHRDSTVFDTLHAENDTNRRVENLLEDQEEPLSREQIFSGLKTELKVEGREIIKAEEAAPVPEEGAEEVVASTVPQDITEPVAAAPAKAEVAAAEPEAVKPEEVKEEPAPAPAVVAAAKPVPTEKPDTKTAEAVSKTEPAAGVEVFQGDRWFVQVASLREGGAAESAWKDLQSSMAVLKPLQHRVKKAELGEKGVYYRVQAGPVTEASARQICAAVEAQKPGGCLVIKD